MKRILLIIIVLFRLSGDLFAKEQPMPESYELNQCAIVQTGDHPKVFLTTPSSEVEALDAATGKVLWHTPKASFVFLAHGNRLLAALPAVQRGKEGCRLAILDIRSGNIQKKLPWPDGKTIGCVGEGISGFFHLEGETQDGQDFVVWDKKWGPTPGGAMKPPGFTYTPGSYGETKGAMEVDFAHEKLSAVIGEVPDTHLKTQQGTGSDYHTERFMVDGITAQAFKKMVKNQAQLILRRWRGSEALPDVKLGEPPWNSCGVVICGDRRHVLGVYQIPDKTNPFLYHIALYSTVTGEKKGEMDATSWPSVAQVCGNFLVCYFPWRVFVMDIKIGKEVWTKPVKDLTYRGPYPPSARPPIKPQMPKADTN